MTIHDVLVETRELLSEPTRWTQKALARDSSDYPTSFNSPFARSWCLVGAVGKVVDQVDSQPTMLYSFCYGRLAQAVRELYPNFKVEKAPMVAALGNFNDVFGYDEVLKVLDHAIAKV